MQRSALLAFLVCSLPAGCMITDGKTHSVAFNLDAATQYNHRGMPQNERGVLQPEMSVNLPTKDGGALDVSSWGNIDLTDSSGDAWLPDDNQGRFSEIDFTLAYSKRFGEVDVTAGVVNYNLLNGLEFVTGSPAGSPRGPTTEVFATVTKEIGPVSPFAEVHYDVDEVEDFYLKGGVGKGFDINEKTRAEASVSLGWSGEDASLWAYGLRESGFADLSGSGVLSYKYDDNTTLRFMLGASTIVDSKLQDWFDVIGIEKDNVWAAIGVGWSY